MLNISRSYISIISGSPLISVHCTSACECPSYRFHLVVFAIELNMHCVQHTFFYGSCFHLQHTHQKKTCKTLNLYQVEILFNLALLPYILDLFKGELLIPISVALTLNASCLLYERQSTERKIASSLKKKYLLASEIRHSQAVTYNCIPNSLVECVKHLLPM